MSRGVTGPFETRKPGIGQTCITGDIERAAGLTVYEPDEGVVHGDPSISIRFPLCGPVTSAQDDAPGRER
jgi:hypothetical protein